MKNVAILLTVIGLLQGCDKSESAEKTSAHWQGKVQIPTSINHQELSVSSQLCTVYNSYQIDEDPSKRVRSVGFNGDGTFTLIDCKTGRIIVVDRSGKPIKNSSTKEHALLVKNAITMDAIYHLPYEETIATCNKDNISCHFGVDEMDIIVDQEFKSGLSDVSYELIFKVSKETINKKSLTPKIVFQTDPSLEDQSVNQVKYTFKKCVDEGCYKKTVSKLESDLIQLNGRYESLPFSPYYGTGNDHYSITDVFFNTPITVSFELESKYSSEDINMATTFELKSLYKLLSPAFGYAQFDYSNTNKQ
ncbi:hypothetical protein MHO82_20235 [Vibrio sp. Of7-15]|uniref:hypothetical protein n=1 Tax=Vibrio sp. Of7-15 TaxID=2724879 RepID=UPI001EF2826A|nr:hypothetical protein [Vibrio sp. Of7-15]MCG7499199.1 hypothetical protein [Vibrio sp. Of7-15]